MIQKGQASLEYMLLMAAFFSAFAAMLPAISHSTEAFFEASDTSLASHISNTVEEQAKLFHFLGEGSKKVFEFSPAQKIIVHSEGKSVFFSSSSKSFGTKMMCQQMIPHKEFSKNFFVSVSKEKAAGKKPCTIIRVSDNRP